MQYFKQYGAKRTGTNFLRALLEVNFEDAGVLMHVLGNKHAPPVDLESLLPMGEPDPLRFVQAASEAALPEPAFGESASPSLGGGQIAFMQERAGAIHAAAKDKSLHFLISIKSPYAWIQSMLGQSWLRKQAADPKRMEELLDLVAAECAAFNALYGSYWQLLKTVPRQTTLVRYHELLASPAGFLEGLRDKLGLKPASNAFADILTTAFPTDWDDSDSSQTLGKRVFNRDYYLQKRFMADLLPEMIAVLEREIDWELMQNLGYEKHGSERAGLLKQKLPSGFG